MNGQDSLSANQHRGQNIDDEVHEQHIDPQENLVDLTKGRRSTRVENSNQRREKSILMLLTNGWMKMLMSQILNNMTTTKDDIQHMAMEKGRLEKELEEKKKLIERLLRNEEVREHSNITNASSTSRSFALAQSARPSTPAQSVKPSRANSRPLQVGAKVLLNGIVAPVHVVKDTIVILNSAKLLGNGELGPEWCEVKVIEAIKYDEPLIRNIGGVKVIGQAIGHNIVWPKHLVQLEDAR